MTTARVADEFDSARINWTFWAYNGRRLVADPHKPPSGANVNQGALAILDRPYPRAVAGLPESWSWDATARTFDFDYTPSGPGTTEVWTSPLHFPAGYRAEVTGADVVSPPGAPVLALRARRGASLVSVRLSPA